MLICLCYESMFHLLSDSFVNSQTCLGSKCIWEFFCASLQRTSVPFTSSEFEKRTTLHPEHILKILLGISEC